MTERRDAPWDEQMAEVDTEQLLAEWFEDEAPTREPAVLAPNVIARTALTRRRTRWVVRDWWRDLFRGAERTPLIPALGTGVLAVVAVLMLAVVAIGPLGLLKSTPTVPDWVPAEALIVSMDDARRTEAISEAIAGAEDGDTVAILPGEYAENLFVDKDITLLGAGERDEIVLRPANPDEPVLRVDGGDAVVMGFTIEGPSDSVVVTAANPTFERMTFRDIGDQWWTFTGAGWDGLDEARPSILVELFSEVVVRDSDFIGGGEIEVRDNSTALIEGNTLVDGAAIFLNDASDETVVRGNTITHSGLFSIESTSCASLLIEGNTITQPDPGIAIQAMCLSGTISDNVIDGANVGIQLGDGAAPAITGNRIDTDGVALEVRDVDPENPTLVTGNELCGANAIIAVNRDAQPPDVSDNVLCEAPLVYEP